MTLGYCPARALTGLRLRHNVVRYWKKGARRIKGRETGMRAQRPGQDVRGMGRDAEGFAVTLETRTPNFSRNLSRRTVYGIRKLSQTDIMRYRPCRYRLRAAM